MKIIDFIFGLGIAFSIFGFLWGIIMLLVNILRRDVQGNRQVQDYGLRIIKYFLLVSATANYIVIRPKVGNATSEVPELNDITTIVLGVLVLGFYLLSKLKRRAVMSQLANNPMFARFTTKIDIKVERFLILGSLIYFALCILFPDMVNNRVVNWFSESIVNIYNTPVFGWIFAIVAFFFLIRILIDAANVVGSLVTGQPLNQPNPNQQGGPFGNFENNAGTNPFDQFRARQQASDDFVDYEDVTDDEDQSSKSDDTNKLN